MIEDEDNNDIYEIIDLLLVQILNNHKLFDIDLKAKNFEIFANYFEDHDINIINETIQKVM